MAIRGTRRRVITPRARLTPIVFIDPTTRHGFITTQARKRFPASALALDRGVSYLILDADLGPVDRPVILPPGAGPGRTSRDE